MTFDPQQNSKTNRVLSYDQILYKDLKGSENPLLHEELLGEGSLSPLNKTLPYRSEAPVYQRSGLPYNRDALSGLTKDQINDPTKFRQAKSEELGSKLQLQEPSYSLNKSPFIEESDSSPFYAGWDDTLRRFVVTNKFFADK